MEDDSIQANEAITVCYAVAGDKFVMDAAEAGLERTNLFLVSGCLAGMGNFDFPLCWRFYLLSEIKTNPCFGMIFWSCLGGH
jgi:hypothetical protein